jgi:8-oxo-dGTP diphosphatase
MSDVDRVHVVVAALVHGGRVFIAKRPAHKHQGGLWEFPGGKVEPGESPALALERELNEEIGICVKSLRPLIRIKHDYEDRKVLLDVWHITNWEGEAHGAEGQKVAWTPMQALRSDKFPVANRAIITALLLPTTYFITPEPMSADEPGLRSLHVALKNGARLVQLRAKQLQPAELRRLAIQYTALCKSYGAKLLVNTESELAESIGADGVHLSARQLKNLTERPLSRTYLVGASCHDENDLVQAAALNVDFAVLSPVKCTNSHKTAEVLGWDRFGELVNAANMPVYALGGLGENDLPAAWATGAQGVAGISNFWELPFQ